MGKSTFYRAEKPSVAYVIVKLVEDEPKRYLRLLTALEEPWPTWTTTRSIARHFATADDALGQLIALRDAAGKVVPRMRVERFVIDVSARQAAARKAG
jgi:hypothetical protein